MKFALLYLLRLARLGVLTAIFLPVFLLARFRFLPWLGGRGPVLLRWYLETSGAGFVKIGQILAMRYDLLSPVYCRELAKLLDQMPALPIDVIRQEIERSLGKPIAQLFQSLSPKPLGTASLAQVHEARLLTNERVAVKVRRPGIERRIRADLVSLRALAWFLDLSGLFLPLRLKSVVYENQALHARGARLPA